MHFQKILTSFAIGLAFYSSPSIANSAGCTLTGVILNCKHEGTSPEEITKSFSSQETRKVLNAPLSQKSLFANNGDLEKYRVSMEKNWRVVTRLSKQKERNRSNGRISKNEFQNWIGQFAEAEKSYNAALNFYRQLHWQGLR